MNRSLLALVAAAYTPSQLPPPLARRPAATSAGAAAPKAAAAPPLVEGPQVYPPLQAMPIPNVETFTLPNGMKLFLLEDHELPLVHGAARIRTGNLFDPPDKIGLATVTGMVLRTGGTRAKTGDQLNEELEDIAASVESSIDETLGSVSFSCLKENTGEVLAAFTTFSPRRNSARTSSIWRRPR